MKMNNEWLILFTIFVVGIRADSDCPGTTSCLCSKDISGIYEIICGDRNPYGKQHILVDVEPGKHVKLQCPPTMEGQDRLNLLQGLRVGPVKSFTYKRCPLPGGSFRDLLNTMGIPDIESLQVQSYGNLSSSLKPEHLADLHKVSRLHLSNNDLSILDEDLFRDLNNLTWLDLMYNNVQLPRGIFRYVPKLEVFELGRNNLSSIEPGLFRNLKRLRLLNLWGNSLRNLTRAVFSDVPNLESLDLSSNGLVTLTPDIFADLPKLKNINLSGNSFIAFPQGLFLSTPNLEKFKADNNGRTLRTLPAGLLADLAQLKDVYLNACNISKLPEDLLWGSKNLANLNLSRNVLVEIPENLLKDANKLQNLDLSRNRLVFLPELFFRNLEKLETLNLAHNNLKNLSHSLFSKLSELQVLRLEHNSLQFVGGNPFQGLRNLQTVNLSYNKISRFSTQYSDPDFGHRSLLQSCTKLRQLYLSHNNISVLFSDWRISMTQLQILDLSYNSMNHLLIDDLEFVATRLTLDVSYNSIAVIVMDNAERLALAKYGEGTRRVPLENNSVKVILKGNPLVCNCRAYSLVKYLSGELTPEVHYIAEFDANNLTCASPQDFVGMPIKSINYKLLSCKLDREECPEACDCHYRPWDKGLLVDCSGRGLTAVPDSMPSNNYTVAYTNYTALDLSNNLIKQLPTSLGEGYERVTKFILSDNNITSINVTKLPKRIQVLELDGNNLTRLDTLSLLFLQESTNLERVTFHNNPWVCDCQTKSFLNFLHSSYEKVQQIGNITCKGGGLLSKMTVSELCPTSGIAWGVGMFGAVVGVLMGAIAALYYRYQREIKVWLYANRFCLWFVTEEELDKDKLYDAFVSYSHQDEDFVVNKLVPGLEEEGPTKFKLCLHYRDWIVGDFIPNQIARSVEDSRRTVVVLSPNFLESIWGRMEFKAAHSQALSEGRARVIIVLYGDIGPTEDLDPELRAYLSMNTYVKWGDPWFWDKLRYALPHPSPPAKSRLFPLLSRRKTDSLVPDPTAVNTPPANAIIIDPLSVITDTKPV